MKNFFTKQAKWIGASEGSFNFKGYFPAVQLRKTFVMEKPAKAECLICGLGLFTLYINGKRVGDDVLSPAFTAYDKRALFVRYDVSNYLVLGENVVSVKLGNGQYNQPVQDSWHFSHASWRNAPKLLFELFINGETALVSDKTWKCSLDGATVHNVLRTGEFYDARKEDAWRELGYDDGAWQQARLVRPCGGVLEEQSLPPIRECDKLSAISVWKSEKGYVFDFGKNIAGYVGLRMQGESGQTISLHYAELLEGKEIAQYNINPYVKSEVGDFSEDRYTFAGKGVEEWKPEFVYHGFRYVEVTGLTEEPPIDCLTAYHVHTDLLETGYFHSSDETLNWLFDAAKLSFINNFHGYPQDCPHREKNGWTGDAACSAEYSLFLFDMEKAYYKWLKDVCDTQRPCGEIAAIAPSSGWGYNWGNGPAWDYALFHIPYAVYQNGGGTDCLALCYPSMKKYLKYVENFILQDGTVSAFGLGDWCYPRKVEDLRLVSEDYSDSCHVYSMFCIASKTAEILGKSGALFAAKAEKLRLAILHKFADGDKIEKDGQTALAMAVHFGIVQGPQAERVAKRLVERIQADDYQIKFGILGAKAMYNVLAKYGYKDVAYKLVSREEYPSYKYWKNHGATTLWERWEESTREILASCDHHMYGSVTEFLVKGIAGLENTGVGYETCKIQPYFFADTCACECGTKTPYGEISVKWKKEKGMFLASFVIPNEVEATLILPNGKQSKIRSGNIKIKL